MSEERAVRARHGSTAARAAMFASLLATVVVLGVIDFQKGPDFSLSLFYLGPIAFAAWRLGQPQGFAVALLASAVWLTADLLHRASGELVALSLWNGFSRAGIFVGASLVVWWLRRERDRLSASIALIQQERARQEAFIRALRDPILVVDQKGTITRTNRGAEQMFGAGANLVGRSISEVLPFVAEPRRADRTGTGVVSDALGESVEVEVSRAALVGAGGDEADLYVLHDITRHAEITRLREQLLYSVAHELRGPLGVLDNALDILDSDYTELEQAELTRLLGTARRTAHRLRTLMEDLLSAGAIQSGRFGVDPRPVSLRAILNEAAETVEAAMGDRDQRLDMELPSGIELIVRADPRYARQVLSNLLANASKYGPRGAPIRVSVESRNGEVRVEVEDHGPGIPKEQQTGLFERYYRVRPGNQEPGIGLGLAISKGIVEAHGGRIGIDSRVGRGTKVWFTLPVARQEGMS